MISSPPSTSRATLLESTQRDDYLARVGQSVRDLHASRDQFQAVELLGNAAGCLGAETAVFLSLVRESEASSACRILVACNPGWSNEYEHCGGFEADPWLRYALRHAEPVRDVEIPVVTERGQAIIDVARRYGFRAAVIIPSPATNRLTRAGVLYLGSSVPGYFDDDGYLAFKVVARGVAAELNQWWLERLRDELLEHSNLSSADLQILSREWSGCSTKMIARELGWSTGAVDCRFQRVIAKLGVANRGAAARLAAEYGLI